MPTGMAPGSSHRPMPQIVTQMVWRCLDAGFIASRSQDDTETHCVLRKLGRLVGTGGVRRRDRILEDRAKMKAGRSSHESYRQAGCCNRRASGIGEAVPTYAVKAKGRHLGTQWRDQGRHFRLRSGEKDDETIKQIGGLDILVNSAAHGPTVPLLNFH